MCRNRARMLRPRARKRARRQAGRNRWRFLSPPESCPARCSNAGRERFSSAAHAAHHFVCDQKNSVLATDFRDTREVSLGRHSGIESRANNRLEDKSSGFLRFVLKKMAFEIVGASEFALRESFFERAVVAKTRSNVPPFRDERFVRRAAREISADRHRTKSAAVIALPARENAVAVLLAAFNLKLAREFNGCFGSFGAAGREVDAAAGLEIR